MATGQMTRMRRAKPVITTDWLPLLIVVAASVKDALFPMVTMLEFELLINMEEINNLLPNQYKVTSPLN